MQNGSKLTGEQNIDAPGTTARGLREELLLLGPWLGGLMGVGTVDAHLAEHGPLSATYTWQGSSSDERFLLSIKVAQRELTILNLWLPLPKRRQGIGSAVMERLLGLCKVYEIREMLFEPRPGSEGFWTTWGFTPSRAFSYWRKTVAEAQ